MKRNFPIATDQILLQASGRNQDKLVHVTFKISYGIFLSLKFVYKTKFILENNSSLNVSKEFYIKKGRENKEKSNTFHTVTKDCSVWLQAGIPGRAETFLFTTITRLVWDHLSYSSIEPRVLSIHVCPVPKSTICIILPKHSLYTLLECQFSIWKFLILMHISDINHKSLCKSCGTLKHSTTIPSSKYYLQSDNTGKKFGITHTNLHHKSIMQLCSIKL